METPTAPNREARPDATAQDASEPGRTDTITGTAATPERPYLPLGQHIRRLRQLRGTTQIELAKQAAMSFGYMQKIEQGVARPAPRALRRIAEAIDADYFTLMELSGFIEPRESDVTLKMTGAQAAVVRRLLDWPLSFLERWERAGRVLVGGERDDTEAVLAVPKHKFELLHRMLQLPDDSVEALISLAQLPTDAVHRLSQSARLLFPSDHAPNAVAEVPPAPGSQPDL